MPLTVGSITGYVLTAVASATFGFLVSGFLAAAKVSQLYHRLDHLESMYQRQAMVLGDVAKMLHQMTASSANGSSSAFSMAHIEQLLASI